MLIVAVRIRSLHSQFPNPTVNLTPILPTCIEHFSKTFLKSRFFSFTDGDLVTTSTEKPELFAEYFSTNFGLNIPVDVFFSSEIGSQSHSQNSSKAGY